MNNLTNEKKLVIGKPLQKEQIKNTQPKSLKERLEWLYKNDSVFKAEKDLIDSVKNSNLL